MFWKIKFEAINLFLKAVLNEKKVEKYKLKKS